MQTPTELVETGFHLACDKHEGTYARWRELHKMLFSLGKHKAQHDAGVADARIDLLLREMEDEQVRYIESTGSREPSPYARTVLQVQLSRYWIVGTSEMLRVVLSDMETTHPLRPQVKELMLLFGAFRMPISKQQPQNVKDPGPVSALLYSEDGPIIVNGEPCLVEEEYLGKGTYRVKPLFHRKTGSIGFAFYDGNAKSHRLMPRRTLSDHLLAFSCGDGQAS